MPAETKSPLNTYLEHLEKGELAYQFSPEAGKAVFYPRVLCPFTGNYRKGTWGAVKGDLEAAVKAEVDADDKLTRHQVLEQWPPSTSRILQ